jgi:hypothetical protein
MCNLISENPTNFKFCVNYIFLQNLGHHKLLKYLGLKLLRFLFLNVNLSHETLYNIKSKKIVMLKNVLKNELNLLLKLDYELGRLN